MEDLSQRKQPPDGNPTDPQATLADRLVVYDLQPFDQSQRRFVRLGVRKKIPGESRLR